MISMDFNSDEESGIQFTGGSSKLGKLLECSVCYDVILPPIILCRNGHSVCNPCREKLKKCPECRGRFTKVRNLLAENILDTCVITCKFKKSGCKTKLSGWELSSHQETCSFRVFLCPQCLEEVSYEDILEHLRVKENFEIANAQVVITGFQFDKEGLLSDVMEPVWMHCHERDFFCFLNKLDMVWILWVEVFGPPEVYKEFLTSIIIWNAGKNKEIEFVGDVHPLRSSLENVRNSKQCLTLEESDFEDFLINRGIDIKVQIIKEFKVPKEERGTFFRAKEEDGKSEVMGLVDME